MSASIGRSLRVPSFLVVGLVMAAIGVRPEPAPGQSPQMPPAPKKSMPVAASGCPWSPRPSPNDCCKPLDFALPTSVSNDVQEVSFPTNRWMDGELFHATIQLKDQAAYDDFVNKKVLIGHMPKDDTNWYAWHCARMVPGAKRFSYHLLFYACKKKGHLGSGIRPGRRRGRKDGTAEAGSNDGGYGGTGTGTVIIVTNPTTTSPTPALASAKTVELDEIQ